MGQAKARGTFEERKAAAIERDEKRRAAYAEVQRRKPSPKHSMLMATILGMAYSSGSFFK